MPACITTIAQQLDVQHRFQDAERALDAHMLQVLGRNGWYDIRRNGKTKRWVTRPHQAELPVKLGLREAFRLNFDNTAGGCNMSLRIRPDNFDPRNRRA